MKLRPIRIAITVMVTATLLFGGWFVYRQVALEKPIEKLVAEYDGVNDVQLDINQNQVVLNLDLEPNTNIRGLVDYIRTDGKELLNGRTMQLEVKDHSTETLDDFWSSALFTVAEAMETRQYTQIPEKLKEMSEGSIQVDYDIDNENVYVSLSDGEASKYIILPRQPATMGVWPNA
ncbi:hypothetical protein PUW24_24460 [Paenibacillus urinalis]|uniref:Uncharacterized protein n=1 Tax=Paenibacillus urinalis TaxID=521520 RepID=A0AAX3MVP2_9BACL|nr:MULTISPECIES: hypothetical protein [Paenibacillus]WDH81196.1 hypothetical protein PUW23_16860 [Paenibacillus urinalis]WDH97247.1 hypothetical protein PUW24_24460 [Paenibacillus urinalis]WDI00910.1 hypothetical protein PUW25_16685 [Paenibacillus urinalis]GAK40048.1 hypothetical protein TCA2_2537 [Paenibacillus sp. TCA20]